MNRRNLLKTLLTGAAVAGIGKGETRVEAEPVKPETVNAEQSVSADWHALLERRTCPRHGARSIRVGIYIHGNDTPLYAYQTFACGCESTLNLGARVGEFEQVEFKPRAVTLDPNLICPLVFKDSTCRYIGPESRCDKSFACCRALGNEANFRGWIAPRV